MDIPDVICSDCSSGMNIDQPATDGREHIYNVSCSECGATGSVVYDGEWWFNGAAELAE